MNNDFYLTDYEFIEIYSDDNIINYLHKVAYKICSECKQMKEEENELQQLQCHCVYCNNCLNTKHDKATNNWKVLNVYEKRTLPDIECNCGRRFNRDEAKQLRKDITDNDNEQAQNRLREYINTLCMFCCKKLNNISQSKATTSHIVKLQPENGKDKGIEFLDIPHHICNTCYTDKVWLGGNKEETATDEDENEKEEETKGKGVDKRSKQKSSQQNKDMCKICYKKHVIIGKNNNVSCCGAGCVIY